MTGYQILQTAGAILTGFSVYFLTQIALCLMAQPPKPSTTEKKEEKK